MTIIETIRAWNAERNNVRDDVLTALDTRYAARLGLPALAALLDATAHIERAAGRMTASEVLAALAPALQAARGEATERIRLVTGDDRLGVPGLGAIPHALLERDERRVTATEAAALCDGWGATRGHSAPVIRAACGRGELPGELRGKVWYVRVADLREWVASE